MSKILVLDIETAPWLAYGFGPLHTASHSIEQLVAASEVISVGAKWLNDPRMFYADVRYKDGGEVDPNDRINMLVMAYRLLEEADAVITFNGNAFDLPKLRGEFLKAGMPPMHKPTSIDVRTTTSAMGYTSGKLAHVAPLLGCGRKRKHDGFTLWAEYMQGLPKARKEMKLYNLQDVRVLEDVYHVVKRHIRNHPYITEGLCPVCGSEHVEVESQRRTRLSVIDQLRCGDCSAVFEGTCRRVKLQPRAEFVAKRRARQSTPAQKAKRRARDARRAG